MKQLKKIAKRYYFKHILICVLVQMMLFYAPFPNLMANPNPAPGTLPTGPTTPYGGVGSFDPSPGRLDIQNVSNGAVINWQKFDIGAGATTEFHQVSSSAYVLNRVSATDGKASGILGNLNANGGVIVINPYGIVMGPSALINAGKFIASGLGMSDKNFRDFLDSKSGTLKFEAGCFSGDVTNNGTINATEAVYLVGKSVTNTSTGMISCPGGMIVMAAGEKIYLAQSGSNVIVEKLDTGSNAGDNIVTNNGSLKKNDTPAAAHILLAAGDILSQAAITDAGSFVAQANQDITLGEMTNVGSVEARANRNLNVNGALDITGDITLFADFDHVLPGDFRSTAPINAGGNIEVRGNDILFEETVSAGGNLTIKGRDCYETPEWPWGNVTAMKTLTAGGNIKISDTGEKKVWIDGHWEGRTWIDGYWEKERCGSGVWIDGHWEGGWYVPGYWNISYAPGTIFLHDNVTAGGNLMLCNNTETFNDTGFGVRLQAGLNVILAEDGIADSQLDNCTYLHGRHNLEIVALNGRITNDSALFDNSGALPSMLGASLTTISVEGSTLLMEQTPSLNLDNFTFANQTNTDLTLISHSGSVTAVETGAKPENAADQWKSIGATADNGSDNGGNAILLSGNQKDVVTTELRAYHDNITVNAKAAKVRATENVTADTGSINLIAHTDIEASKNLTAGNNITATAGNNILLMGNATAGQNITLVPGNNAEAQGNLTAGGYITASAGNNILLKGNATAGQNITLVSGVDTEAQGNLTATSGSITASAGNNILLKGNATAGQNITLSAVADVEAQGNLSAGQNVTISSSDNTTTLGGNVNAGNSVVLNNNTQLNGAGDQSITAQNGTVLANGTIAKINEGRMSILAADGITLTDAASAVDSMYLSADTDGDGIGDMLAQSTLTTTNGDIEILASDSTIKLQDNVSAGEDLILNNNTEVAAGKMLKAGQDVTLAGGKTMTDIGNLTVNAGRNIGLGGNVTAGQSLVLVSGADTEAQGNLTAGEDVIASAGHNVLLKGNANAGRDILLLSRTDTEAQGNLTAGRNIIAPAGNNLLLKGNTTAGQDIVLASGKNTEAQGNITAGGNITSSAGNNISLKGNATAGRNIYLTAAADVEAQGDLSAGQDIVISSSDNTTYLGGNINAGRDILLKNNTKVNGLNGDQTLEAGNKLTALGYVRKGTPGDMYLKGNSEGLSIDLQYNSEGPGTSTSQGNLWILGQGDIQISGDVTTFGPSEYISIQSEIAVVRSTGGVAIISDEGKIYTRGGDDDTLNVSVTGSSDHFNNTGVYGFGLHTDQGDIEPTILAEADNTEAKAAIAIVSADELKIGENGKLTAYGTYYDNVDDRAAIGFLDTEAEIPAGTSRNPGVPFDLAIYSASKNGSVTVNAPVTIESEPIIVPTILSEKVLVPELDHVAKGAMAIDAYDIVTLGDKFMQSLANGDIGNRLEVCSRITEWLEDAAGRLPFLNSSDLPKGYSYVMRGAGLENPVITDGRAWVLERQEIFIAAAPIQQPELKFTGCPAVMNWVAKELGVENDQIQIYVAGAMAMSSGVQPCDSCARLKNTALVLMDADGAQVKALGEVVNEFTAAGAPPSEEQMAMIAVSLKNPEEGTRYALAAQWLNALAEYINILHSDLQIPTDESMAFAAKYTSPVTGGDNAALAAYVQAKMDALGG